jgi:hypothetical protein
LTSDATDPQDLVVPLLFSTTCRCILNQNDSKYRMIRGASKKAASVRIHSSLEPGDHERLAQLAGHQNSSVARIVKLAVIEYLDRYASKDKQASNKPFQRG